MKECTYVHWLKGCFTCRPLDSRSLPISSHCNLTARCSLVGKESYGGVIENELALRQKEDDNILLLTLPYSRFALA